MQGGKSAYHSRPPTHKLIGCYFIAEIKMKNFEVKLYNFEELTKDAQQKAISKNSDINIIFDWWEITCEEAKNIGINIKTFDLDRKRHAKGEFLLSANEVAANIL